MDVGCVDDAPMPVRVKLVRLQRTPGFIFLCDNTLLNFALISEKFNKPPNQPNPII
jgi:hypothetical protein